MQAIQQSVDTGFDFSSKFLPDGLSKVNELGFLSADERRQLSHIQGRTYANMFGLVERLAAEDMPAGYRFLPQPNEVAAAVLGKSTWAVLALVCHIELFVLAHYHAILDELEWRRENANLSAGERDRAVDDLIVLVGAVDGLLQLQAGADADYFLQVCARQFTGAEQEQLRTGLLRAYRWQYIASGAQDPRFTNILTSMITPEQAERIGRALAPIVA